MDEVTINGVVYIPKTEPEGEIKIVIMQRGFVFVGRVAIEKDQVVIRNAQNIRKWGAERGLGQIASSGPTDKTVLDPSGTVSCHQLTVIGYINCNQSAWGAICK